MRLFVLGLAITALLGAQSAWERAVTLARQKQYAEARQALQEVPEPADAPQRIAFHRVRAAVAAGLGEAQNAAEEMRLALALAPADRNLLLATAAAEAAATQWDAALAHAKQAGETPEALSLTGEIEEQRGNFVEAAKALQAAVTLSPDREDLRIALALELVQHQTFRPAITLLEQSAPRFPQSARLRALLGIAHYALGDNEPAVSALTEAVRLDPGLTPAYAYLTRILLESSSAAPPSATAALCGHDPTVCAALQLRESRERDDSALQAKAIAGLKQAPDSSVVKHCELARAYEWTADWRAAQTEMEACVRLDPSPANHYRLALIYQRLGLADEARAEMQRREARLKELTEEGARRLNATQGFRYTLP